MQSTIGVIFLATPLRGTGAKDAAEWRSFISRILGQQPSTTLIKDLAETASTLQGLVEDFGKMTIRIGLKIRCFYETRPTQILNAVLNKNIAKTFFTDKLVSSDCISRPSCLLIAQKLVEKSSACLDCHDHIPLDARHAMMNKFRGPQDGSFKLVSGCIKELFNNDQIIKVRTPGENKCLQLLASNYKDDKDRNIKRVAGTCEWFLEHPTFLSWRKDRTANLLWVSADPGCGKSVLSRALVDESILSFDNGRPSICYFFFKDDDINRQTSANALCAILHQLFVHKPVLLKYAVDEFQQNGKVLCTMPRTLWDILTKAAADPEAGEIICVLDALDECQELARKDLIYWLSDFHSARYNSSTRLKFLVTSRPYQEIERDFKWSIKDLTSISLKGEEESEKISREIDLVIDDLIPRISSARDYPLEPNVQDSLIAHLKSIKHRTYLWLHLILDVIDKALHSTKARLERLVKKIPRSVEDAYEGILKRINDSEKAEQAKRLLSIVMAANRPLTLREMNVALAIDERLESEELFQSLKDLDLEHEEPFRTKIRNLCGLFVSVIDSRIYLIHQTAKEILVSEDFILQPAGRIISSLGGWKHSLHPVDSNYILVRICLSYLLFNELEQKREQSERQRYDDEILQYIYRGLLQYAAQHWVVHFQEAKIVEEDSVINLAQDVCDIRSNRLQEWFSIYTWIPEFESRYPHNATRLIVASCLGLQVIVKLLLTEDSMDINFKDNEGRTPLWWAAKGGHSEVVKLLLVKDSIELDPKDCKGRTPLLRAARNGHSEVVNLLLAEDGIELNPKNIWSQTPLLEAAGNGHQEIVKLLLAEDNIELNPKCYLGRTPLSQAAVSGHSEVVKLLLAKDGIELNCKDDWEGCTPLSRAAEGGHSEVVKLLLAKDGVERNTKDR